MKWSEIKGEVEELCDGRSLPATRQVKWANRVRTDVAMDFMISGFRGLYFLYKEVTVEGGSIKDQPRYAIPNDFIDDLELFYDKALLSKSPPGTLSITQDIEATGTPEWWRMMGLEFDLRPIPNKAGKEILIFYNGLPDAITDSDELEDYFMKYFPDLHIFGMAEKAASFLNPSGKEALKYETRFGREKVKLAIHNRRHYFKYTRMRFQNWSEYQEMKRHVFPQFISD